MNRPNVGGGGCGAEGDRTPDLRIANAALSQLSYGPGKKSAEGTWGRLAVNSNRYDKGQPAGIWGN